MEGVPKGSAVGGGDAVEGQGHRCVESADAVVRCPSMQGGDIAEADDPGGVGGEGFGFEEGQEARGAVAAAERPNRPDVRVAKGAIQGRSAFCIAATEGAIAGAIGGRREDGTKARGGDRGGGGFPHRIVGEA